jgi:hypothetical protein
MNDSMLLIIILLVAVSLLLLWIFVWGPKAAEARAEQERLAEEQRARREAEHARLQAERDDLLKSIRSGAPGFIAKAQQEFERGYRAGGGERKFGEEMSPLVCFGYRVGKTNGRTQSERRAILGYAVAADLDATLSVLPASYRREWGGPLSVRRFNRIYQHLNSMASLRERRRNFEVAVSHWRADASWFYAQQGPLVEKFSTV